VELTRVTGDPITAILDQLAAHAERLDRLDAREAGDHASVTSQIAALAAIAGRLDAQLAVLAPGDAAAGDGDAEGRPAEYVPAPARRWWKLAGEDRAQAVRALAAWAEQVYRPGYGHLAAPVGPCWDQHPLCLYAMDILAELWSVLYLAPLRSPAVLSAQAEFQARILPALAGQMSAETSRCAHGRPAASPAGTIR
jgi:hypothetical protein